MALIPYLTFNGNCEDAVKFYEAKLGAKVEMLMRHKDSPMAEQAPADWQNKVMHANMTINGNSLMASDCMPGQPHAGMSGFTLSLNVDDTAEAERLFAAIAEEGTVLMPLAATFWAARFGMVTDKFGVPWMVNCEQKAA